MYRETTRAIQVTVEPSFVEGESSPEEGHYFWAYKIEISNLGQEVVRLRSRHWRITDANGRIERFVEKPRQGEVFSVWENAGVYICSERILDEVGSRIPLDFGHDVSHHIPILRQTAFGVPCQQLGVRQQNRQRCAELM